MQPSKQTIHQVFDLSRRLVVPLYQRAYVWEREGQWEPFFADVRRQATAVLSAGGTGVPPQAGHFMGAVVTQAQMVSGGGHPRHHVIDGQQRLTTFQVFLKAFRDRAKGHGHWAVDELLRLIQNPARPHIGPEEIYKVWPSNADRDDFKAVMDGNGSATCGLATAARATAPSRILAAYGYFSEALNRFLDGADADDGPIVDATPSQRIDALHQALTSQLYFVVVELEAGDDPQVIFETLNGRGAPLLPSDLIRNELFLRATREEGNADPLYEQYWKPFEERRTPQPGPDGETRFWHVMERQGRLERPRIDLFVFHWLTAKDPREHLIGKLYQSFSVWLRNADLTARAVLQDLSADRDRYARLVVPEGKDRLSIMARRLKALDTSTVYPLLLYLLGLPETRLPRGELDRVLISLESYLVRRLITGQTSKAYNRTFMALLAAVKAATSAESLGDVVDRFLLGMTGPSGEWPDDARLRKAVLNTPIYVKSKQERTRMLLAAVENHLRTSTKTEEPLVRDDLSIEHLLPQGAKAADYPLPSSDPLTHGEESPEERRDRLVHTLGNLTLLTIQLNSSVSNGAFEAKKANISHNSVLLLNSFLSGPEAPMSWDENAILQRGALIFDHVRVIWPRPIHVGAGAGKQSNANL